MQLTRGLGLAKLDHSKKIVASSKYFLNNNTFICTLYSVQCYVSSRDIPVTYAQAHIGTIYSDNSGWEQNPLEVTVSEF
jgi:hypothetical protein